MGCGCGKNRPKINQLPRNPAIVNQANQTNYSLRVNNTPRPNPIVQVQGNQNIQVQVNGEVINNTTPALPEGVSPAGLDAHKRRIAALRRAAIRNAGMQ
jgi:hypothetical protein